MKKRADSPERPRDEIEVKIVEGETTPEQRQAYRRFMEWYRARIVLQNASN